MGRISDIASGKTSIGGGRLSGVVSSESAVNEKNKYYLEVQKKSRYEEAIKKAQKAQEEAQKAAENLKFWEGIAGIPKQIYQAGKETGAAVVDVASRISPLENIRNTYSGLSRVVNGPTDVPANIRYEQGFQESRGRKTLFEKVSGKDLTNRDGSINWEAGRQFIGRAAEAPTYIYAGAAQGAELVAKGLLTRILTRTAKSLPEASVNTGIQQFEQGNTENIGTNFLANALLLSGISNISGEVRFSKDVAKKTISDIESELGTLSLSEKADVLESIKQGVKPSDIVENVRKVKNNEVAPEELASKINEQAGIKKTEISNVSKTTDSVINDFKSTTSEVKGMYSIDEKKKLFSDVIEPKLKEIGDVKSDETVVYYQGQGKSGQYVNTNPSEVWHYPVDNELQIKKVKTSDLVSTGNSEKDAIGYRNLSKDYIDTSLPEQPKPDNLPKKESVTAKKMNERFGKDEQLSTEYDVISINRQSDEAAHLISTDKEKAVRTAFNDSGSNTEKIAILNELFEKSVIDKDHKMSSILFNRIKQLSTQTAQSLNMFKALTEVNPHYAYMSEVVSSRLNGVKIGARNISEVLKKESKQDRIRSRVSKQSKELKESLSNSVKFENAQKVFNDLICK